MVPENKMPVMLHQILFQTSWQATINRDTLSLKGLPGCVKRKNKRAVIVNDFLTRYKKTLYRSYRRN
jgi:hypothetical protein